MTAKPKPGPFAKWLAWRQTSILARRDRGPIDPKLFPDEHEYKGNGKRCDTCGWVYGQHFWPWDSRGG